MVDDACTTRGRHYRMVWEGYEQHTWEPEWELLGNNFHLGTAREAVHEYCHY